ncbi:MAG: hypothetical protein Q7T26_01870 [Dehalococcoidia bacterium]|nr:hypothetical protein [Dehalococcoidia bacterium]
MTEGVDELRRLVVEAGVMTDAELRLAEAHRLRATPHSGVLLAYRSPLVLTGAPESPPTAALLWHWEVGRADDFCRWATQALRQRFGLDVEVTAGEPHGEAAPQYVEINGGGRREICDWLRVNRDQWMGAFCAIANRVLEPLGVSALALDADEATVLCFCRSSCAERLLQAFPEA